jgi:hypothetical protein
MDNKIIKRIENYVSYILSNRQKNENIFDLLIDKFKKDYEEPAHSISEIREKSNKKRKGDIFEHFCYLYFKIICKFDDVWLLADIPEDIRSNLGLSKIDVGIDIVARENKNNFINYYAIQVKYRQRNPYKSKTGICWKQLSTFYGLVNKTGPWWKHIVITNVDYVRHIGKKTIKDKSICLQSLRGISDNEWMQIASNNKGYTLNSIQKIKIKIKKDNNKKINEKDEINEEEEEEDINEEDKINDEDEEEDNINEKEKEDEKVNEEEDEEDEEVNEEDEEDEEDEEKREEREDDEEKEDEKVNEEEEEVNEEEKEDEKVNEEEEKDKVNEEKEIDIDKINSGNLTIDELRKHRIRFYSQKLI